jgi:pyruvate kinase
MNFAKIVATIGPASEKEEIFSSLVKAGLSVARLNFSHGTHEEHGKRIATIRTVSKKLKKDVAILADLCGPKIALVNYLHLEY